MGDIFDSGAGIYWLISLADRGSSIAWVILGCFWIVLGSLKGVQGSNEYGPDPSAPVGSR